MSYRTWWALTDDMVEISKRILINNNIFGLAILIRRRHSEDDAHRGISFIVVVVVYIGTKLGREWITASMDQSVAYQHDK